MGQKKDPAPAAAWFESLDFSFVGNERYEGREVVVLSFRPKTDPNPKNLSEKFISGLKGQIWIDPAAKATIKIQAELTNVFSVGGLTGLFSSLRPGSALTIENMPIGERLWALKRLEFAFVEKHRGALLLSKTAHSRQVDEMSDYQPFDPDAKDLFTKL